ncbi:MAG TPA: RNA 2',3'-cyclic phosphodiesterase [Methylobacterium sp.]|jgi:2'-5' RNA ligase|uniref:RNA 2',3'-cyclic phosphodiesterase n=1 Tax=Methylorubrum sp. B1-46 TaxID=2897334 RepID=UPI001E41DA5A|nr:RNA 2',3'-cyclic phosphodiesterase [Methylorubrum sp. B1-46]UGB25239.1 RNA 2',3'-cyclic phosphodiesterase [Methylorubrum sp. B1-46]HEV2545409.1 RNA 2',3'-cyclic phosphodiesterase [Methylobacterium sp.]
MPRLFTGLEIPPDIAERLSFFRGGLPGARWVEPSDYHITLRFLGEIDEIVAADLDAGLAEARARPAFTVALDGLASFGGDRPRALYASVVPSPELTELQEEHERIARRAGAAPERRKFTPHVTLARLNREATPEAVARTLTQAGVFPRLTFTARRAALYSARTSRGGGPYLVEAAYPFGGGPFEPDEGADGS